MNLWKVFAFLSFVVIPNVGALQCVDCMYLEGNETSAIALMNRALQADPRCMDSPTAINVTRNCSEACIQFQVTMITVYKSVNKAVNMTIHFRSCAVELLVTPGCRDMSNDAQSSLFQELSHKAVSDVHQVLPIFPFFTIVDIEGKECFCNDGDMCNKYMSNLGPLPTAIPRERPPWNIIISCVSVGIVIIVSAAIVFIWALRKGKILRANLDARSRHFEGDNVLKEGDPKDEWKETAEIKGFYFHAFISYNESVPEDRAFVKGRLIPELERRGFRIYKPDERVGEIARQKEDIGIATSSRFIMIVSPEYFDMDGVNDLCGRVRKKLNDNKIRIIPIILKNFDRNLKLNKDFASVRKLMKQPCFEKPNEDAMDKFFNDIADFMPKLENQAERAGGDGLHQEQIELDV
ncbi:uncharacterized protein LOC106179580 [Lingula anatina]|uniref:Uncharacterized protein LOC106179580 n=1 Tax=Lingula anatina TaxID=7574 RepID=A0A1S3K7Y4_LINAN|nr:uncharacterized protein LOC106179580 [Lingula anatina]|eukprot:XP_013418738.1 uncharacterized protein LOC106179580 [Lingula anatina]